MNSADGRKNWRANCVLPAVARCEIESPMTKKLLTRRTATLLVLLVSVSLANARTLRLFVVGNSFSNNATHYLPDLAKAGGHELIMGKAQTGGCSFERHWNAVEAFLANPEDPKGKIYGGKSLQENIGNGTWDVITVQQYSLQSPDYGTYQPYASKLHAHLKKLQPGAEIVIHQTWAYRSDAAKFGQVGGGKNAATQREMWEKSRAAYWQLAADLGARVIEGRKHIPHSHYARGDDRTPARRSHPVRIARLLSHDA